MKTTILDHDIEVFYVEAKSFPEGILEAHQKLHALVPFSADRKYFGISRPENGVISYKAAAEELTNGEAEKFKLPTVTLKKGKYIVLLVTDYIKNISAIDKAFKQLLAQPDIDPEGYCVEWYLEKDVKCMVRLEK